MNKKLSSLICVALIVIISIPVVSIVFAGKNSRGPPEKIVYIHYKKGYGKPDGTPGKPQKADKEYYTLLVKGAKWLAPIGYVIDPDNPWDLTETFITGAISSSAEEWDSWTNTNLFGSYDMDEASWHMWEDVRSDGRNELFFGDYPREGVIAVAVVWGYFGGRPSGREIIEFDILFDIDFTWGDADVSNVMDLQNIATHELGHGVGLGDLYKTETSDETMYGYSTEGETKKRDLNPGDIAGIQFLYGE